MSDTPIVDRCFVCGRPCEMPLMVDVHGVPRSVCTRCLDRTVKACRRLCDSLAQAFAGFAEAFRTAVKTIGPVPAVQQTLGRDPGGQER